MPPVEFEGKQYYLVMGSDVIRDGMWLEFYGQTDGDAGVLVLTVFYSNADGRMSLTAYETDLPLQMVEWFIARARELLPPFGLTS